MRPPTSSPPSVTPEQRQAIINAQLASAKANATAISAAAQAAANRVSPGVSATIKAQSQVYANTAQEVADLATARSKTMSTSAQRPTVTVAQQASSADVMTQLRFQRRDMAFSQSAGVHPPPTRLAP
eukprot:1605842-Karenia_brevis.AAC.1